jgi:glycosyltransferase involved in cell wall biosynthesis
MKIAIFKPGNAGNNNSFNSGQYPIFRKLNESVDYNFTIFVDDPKVAFDEISIEYVEINIYVNFFLKIIKKLFSVRYIKIPYYKNIDFSEFDVVITEGIHYKFLHYFKDYKGLLILNDSITSKNRIKNLDFEKINIFFEDALVVAVNEKIPILYKKYGINLDTIVIGHSLQLEKIDFKERKNFTGKILSVGRLVEEKGYIYIFQAIKNVIVDYPSITLDIYGDGPLETYLNTFIQENDLQNHIKIFNPLEYEALLEKFSRYDLFISHPLETNHIAEAFHMANMEAMASGIPVITTDCGGVPYVVEDCAIVNKQKDIKAIETSIKNLYHDNEKYNKLSLVGYKHILTNYSLEVIQEKWTRILKIKI